MRKIKYMLFAIAAVALSGCRPQVIESQSGLQLKITTDHNGYVDKVVKSGTGMDVNTFIVNIARKDGKYSNTWSYAEIPALIELSTGEYNVSVTSPETALVAWDTPVYSGSVDFAIVAGVVTPLEVVCTLQNMKNSVYCSQHFMDRLTDFEVKISNADGHLVWGADEVGIYTESSNGDKTIVKSPSKHAYFSVEALTVNVDGYREIDNTTANLKYEIKDVAARDHHIIYLDAHVTGQSSMTLSIDTSVNDKLVDMILPGIDPDDSMIDDDIEAGWEEPGEEQPSIPDVTVQAPYLVWEANPDFEKMDIEAGMSVELMVYAPGKIKEFVVKVSDNFLPAIQILVPGAEYLDLIGDETAKEALGSMLPVGDQLLGQTEVMFSLSQLVPLIAAVGNPGEDYIFTLEVTDEKDQKLVKDVLFYNPVVE
ncbi:MAG: DUF4493 domain-containing protein [Bacteroidales bacterium]|nr:DUF4493 domain-containing protein [Bacteroidales bacterium]MBR5862904.1 DUF4493 domain-containing protein [Bacteroidales bacterium]